MLGAFPANTSVMNWRIVLATHPGIWRTLKLFLISESFVLTLLLGVACDPVRKWPWLFDHLVVCLWGIDGNRTSPCLWPAASLHWWMCLFKCVLWRLLTIPCPVCVHCSVFNNCGCFVPELDHEAITADASVFTAVPSPPAPTPA
jgi:hypothetical protein